MKKRYFFLCLLLSTTCLTQAQTNKNSAAKHSAALNTSRTTNDANKEKQALLQIERNLVKAQIDANTDYVTEMLASDYKWVGQHGRMLNKKQYSDDLSKTPAQGITLIDTLMEARVTKNAGAVTGIYGVIMGSQKMAIAFTDVFVREDNAWKLFSSHETNLPFWTVWKPADSDLIPLTPMDCSSESSVKSLTSDVPALIRFKNNTSKEVTVYWINYSGERDRTEGQVRILPSEKSIDIKTFITHPFVVIDAAGKCLGLYQPSHQPSLVLLQ